MARDFITPVGRIVQGDPFEPQTKDAQGKPREKPQFFISVAFPKNDPAWPDFERIIKEEAAASFPHLFPQGAAGSCSHPSFSFKIIDGDGFDANGKPNSNKPGFAGNWVVRFTSTYAPTCYPMDTNEYELTEKGSIKRGWYVQVAGNVAGNANAQRPGVYVNLGRVKLRGYGEEIRGGKNPDELFGDMPPVGTPVPQPAPDSPMPPPPTPTTNGPRMTPKAGGLTYDQYRSAGWTDEQLRSNGLME